MYFVYILASRKNGTLYVGVTNDLLRRLDEHDTSVDKNFTRKYSVKRLVYFETFERVTEAIAREKQLKNWQRAWKVRLIETTNADWNDLSETVPYA